MPLPPGVLSLPTRRASPERIYGFQGAWDRKFDWKDQLTGSYQVLAYNPQSVTRPDGGTDWVQGSNMAFQCAESVKLERATVAGIKSAPDSLFHLRIPFDQQVFSLDGLAQMGK